ncbi:glycosyltransferase [Cryobacterium gelidum]|nr:glycosyltransferase [Cryobacterium gelidum]
MFTIPAQSKPEVSRIGMVARLDPWKGQRLLLEAFSDNFAGSSVRLVLAGSPAFGNEAFLAELRKLARQLGVEGQVDFLGHVTDVAKCIDSLDICVQSSLRPEPLGQNILQYLARGKPIIAANEGGPTEWIESGKNGIFFQARDRASLARKLSTLAEDAKLRERLADAASKTAGLMIDEDVAHAHLDFFRRVLDDPRMSDRGRRDGQTHK